MHRRLAVNELKRLRDCLKYLRKEVNEELPIRQLEILLYVAAKGEASVMQLAADVDLPKGTASKTLELLADKNFLVKTRDAADARLVAITLSSKGQAVVDNLQTLLEEVRHG